MPATVAESAALWARIREQDEEVFECLERLVKEVCRPFLRGKGAPESELERLLQDTLASIWDYSRGVEEVPRNFRTFLQYRSRAVLSAYRQALRRDRLDPAPPDVEELAGTGFDPERAVDMEDIVQALEECVAELPDRYRNVWRARYEAERSNTELARDFDVPKVTIGVWLLRARRRIRECLERKGIR